MADTQAAPQPAIQPPPAPQGSVTEAQEALLSLLEPEEETLETEEAQPAEEEESQPEEEDESFEEEPEEEEEESEGTDEEAEEDLLYAVTVNGEEQEVSLDELMKGYSRQSDYTRKTQEVSEQRKEFDAMKQQMAQEYQQIQAERQQYVQNMQSLMEGSMSGLDKFAEVNWELLKETDPIEFVTKKEEFREAQEKVQRLQQEQHVAQQRSAAQAQQEHRRVLAEEGAALVKAIPEWGDSAKQQEMASNLRSYAMENGFTKEELDSLIDHRSILVLLKAQKYDKLQKTDVKSKKLKNKPRVVRAGSGVSKDAAKNKQRSAQMKRLRGTGHIDDASALLEDFIDI
jgi:hypothetical protein